MNNRYMSNNIERNATWRVGVYCRLSKDDELTGESASISNQRHTGELLSVTWLAGGGCVSGRWLYRIEHRPT